MLSSLALPRTPRASRQSFGVRGVYWVPQRVLSFRRLGIAPALGRRQPLAILLGFGLVGVMLARAERPNDSQCGK